MAKNLIIGYQSALLVYRAAAAGILEVPDPLHGTIRPAECSTRISDFSGSTNLEKLMSAGPLDLLAFRSGQRHDTRSCRMHLTKSPMVDGAFWSLGSNILVASPDLTYLQVCQEICDSTHGRVAWAQPLIDVLGDLGKLIACAEVCAELCGYYCIYPDNESSLKPHIPYTSREHMLVTLRQLKGRHPLQTALRACKAAPSLSASPRETDVFLLMTLPRPDGYGIGRPTSNEPITVMGTKPTTLDDMEETRFSDFLWKQKTLRNGRRRKTTTLEYDSDEHHTASAGLTDRQLWEQGERRDRIESSGRNFLRLTTEHTKEFRLFDKKMYQLAEMLRIDLPERGTDELAAVTAVFEAIFDTHRWRNVNIIHA